MPENAAQIKTAGSRGDVYRLLSACFYQPEAAFLEEDVFGQLATALAGCKPELAPLAKQLETAFREATMETLLLDYTQLFLGPFNIAAKPYGSIYLEGDKVVMGDSTIDAKSYYRIAAFDIADDFHEVPDHIAVELEFLYLLCFKQSQSPAVDDSNNWQTVEEEFLQKHIGRWIKPFAKKIKDHAKTDFYRSLAELTERFIAQQQG